MASNPRIAPTNANKILWDQETIPAKIVPAAGSLLITERERLLNSYTDRLRSLNKSGQLVDSGG